MIFRIIFFIINLKITSMKQLRILLLFSVLGFIPIQMFAWPGVPLPVLHTNGQYLQDPCGNNVLLHGVAITLSPWFNGCASGTCRWDNYDIQGCLNYNNAVMDALTNTSNGWYLNYIRLHIDPYWTNNPGTSTSGEADISQFNYDRLVTYTNSVIIPLINHAASRGMYVILRPPGVCPQNIALNDAYYNYLVTVWTYLSQNSALKNAANVMFELANEPVNIKASDGTYGQDAQKYYDALKNFFQPIVNLIRNNGATNVIWVPGLGYQSLYRGLANNPITGSNIGYAVHVYPGYWGADGQNATAFNNAWNTHVQPIANIAPIVITETDWSPDGSGTWGTGTTSGFGNNLKGRIDATGNASWNLLAPEDLITNGDPYNVTTAFNNNWEACGASCKSWFQGYSCCNLPASNCGCTSTSITPYIQVDGGAWQQTSSVTVSSGATVILGPQPTSGGSWSWSGCGTSGTSREQTIHPTNSCTSTATYTNSCGANSTQNFTVNVSGSTTGLANNGIYVIEFKTDATKALDLLNGTDADGTVLRPWTKNGATAQQWVAKDAGSGYWRFVTNVSSSNRCIDLSGGNTTNGTKIQLWSNYSNDAQAWQVVDVGGGYYKIVSKLNTSRGFDVPNCVMDGTQNLQLYDYLTSSCQQFKFNYVGTKSARVIDADIAKASSIEVYPNPSNDGNFTVLLSNLKTDNSKLTVYSLDGKKVYEKINLREGTNNINSGLKNGLYILKTNCSNNTYTQKLIVK
jgi:endoglucanase